VENSIKIDMEFHDILVILSNENTDSMFSIKEGHLSLRQSSFRNNH